MRGSIEVEARGDFSSLLRGLGEAHTPAAHRVYYEALARPAIGEAELVWRIDYGRLVDRLPDEQRFLMWAVAAGYTQCEIAEQMGWSLRTVVRRFARWDVRPDPFAVARGKRPGRPPKERG